MILIHKKTAFLSGIIYFFEIPVLILKILNYKPPCLAFSFIKILWGISPNTSGFNA